MDPAASPSRRILTCVRRGSSGRSAIADGLRALALAPTAHFEVGDHLPPAKVIALLGALPLAR